MVFVLLNESLVYDCVAPLRKFCMILVWLLGTHTNHIWHSMITRKKHFCSFIMAAMIQFFWYQLFRTYWIKLISVKLDILYDPCMTTRKLLGILYDEQPGVAAKCHLSYECSHSLDKVSSFTNAEPKANHYLKRTSKWEPWKNITRCLVAAAQESQQNLIFKQIALEFFVRLLLY